MIALVLGLASPAAAVHAGGPVELDTGAAGADITDPAAGDPRDWGLPVGQAIFRYDAGTDTTTIHNAPAGTVASSFTRDFIVGATGPDNTYFEPSSKDAQVANPAALSSGWGCVSASNPTDKNDILNAAAIAVNPASGVHAGEKLIYVMGERFDNNGTAFMGVWFFQRNVGCTGPGRFTGPKTDGDILVLLNFSKGGEIANTTLEAFQWHPCNAGPTPLPASKCSNPAADAGYFTGAPTGPSTDCGDPSLLPGDRLCASINRAGVTPPWPTKDKDAGAAGLTLDAGEFFEMGFNLTDAFSFAPGEEPCISSFMVETRSSDSLSATLKDFAGGNFDTCGAIAAHKYHDLDADGTKDAGEPGLPGWKIFIDENGDEQLQTEDADCDGSLDPGEDANGNGTLDGEQCGTTDVNGDTLLEAVNAGTHSVCEVLQPGWLNSDPAGATVCRSVVVTTSDTAVVVFGNYQNATKSGTKFEDGDADGSAREAGEPGLAGWTIYVDYDGDDALDGDEPSAVTDSNGNYEIAGIKPGTWKVREVSQAGWTCSFPNAGTETAPVASTACEYDETFTSGAARTGNDFGNWTTATKAGTKFEDGDADGSPREAGETGLGGWTIYVDYDNDGVLDAGEPSGVTASDGTYTLSGVNPGTYKVREVGQPGWTCSYPNAGTENAPVTSTACYHEETFGSRAALTGNDFGNWTTSSASGTKFEDLDADGSAREAGEPGLPGWTIFVDYDDDGALDADEPSDVTVANGSYSISGIAPGNYKIREVPQAGWTCSFPNVGTEVAPVASTACHHSETFTSGGAAANGRDFGNWTTATKSGTKFEDLDADGAPREVGEDGIVGWTIYVDYDDDGTLDADEPSTVTVANGNYLISGIVPGSYKVREVAQAGWTCSFPNAGTETAPVASTACYHDEEFTSRAALTGNDFGNWTTASKSGTKFEDLDADGSPREAGEPGLPGWTFYVDYDGDGALGAGEPSAVSDADGVYTITEVNPGAYDVREVEQAGWTCSFPASCLYGETFTSRSAPTGNDFGNWANATKTGTKFNDVNGSRVRDAGEPGLAGWEIHLFGTAGDGTTVNVHTTTAADDPATPGTDETGTYSFSVPPGIYTVCESMQSGWTQTYPEASTPDSADCSAHTTGSGGASITPGPRGWAVTLTSRRLETGNDFGNTQPVVGQGCTPGYWKNHTSRWDGNGDQVVQAVKAAIDGMGLPHTYNPAVSGMTNQLFRHVFGLTSAQMSAAGLSANITMLKGINLGGGGFQKLARHGIAGLLSSAATGVDYAFSETQVLTAVRDAIVTLSAEPTAQNLANENNKSCPLN